MNRKSKLFSFLLILLGSFFAYGNTLGHDFIWDDLILIVDSDALRKAGNFGAFFTTPFFKLAAGINFPHHRPMVPLLIFFTSLFSGINPFGYHLLSMVLHACVTWLFYLFLQKINLKTSVRIFAAAVFLFHPVHVEAVAWPCSAAVLAGGIFFLSGLLLSCGKKDTRNARAFKFFGTVAAYGAGLLSYDLVIVMPAVILLYDFLHPSDSGESKTNGYKILELVLLSAIAADFLWMRYRLADSMGGFARFQHGDPNAANVLLQNIPGEALPAVLNVISRYVELLVFPLVLNPEVYFRAEHFSVSALASLALFTGATFFALTRKNEDKKPLLFALGWTLLALLPLAQLIFQGGLFADRYLYFASMGFALWLAIMLETILNSARMRWSGLGRKIIGAFAVLLCLAYGFRTYDQNKIWRDDLTFWNAASVFSPEKPRVHHLRGVSLLRFGYPEKALESFHKAIQLSPSYPHPYQGIAIALRQLGKNAEADRAEAQAAQKYQEFAQLQASGGKH